MALVNQLLTATDHQADRRERWRSAPRERPQALFQAQDLGAGSWTEPAEKVDAGLRHALGAGLRALRSGRPN